MKNRFQEEGFAVTTKFQSEFGTCPSILFMVYGHSRWMYMGIHPSSPPLSTVRRRFVRIEI